MKRRIALLLALLTLGATIFTSCKNVEEPEDATIPYNYDLSKYVTLADYIGVEYVPASLEVTDAEVDEEIASVLEDSGTYAIVAGRGAELGDKVNIDYVGTIDGVAFSGGTASGTEIVLGKANYIDGFETGLVGVKSGETVALDLRFPDNYGKEDLNGKDCVFTITVNAIYENVIPELSDEFVTTVSSESATVEEYRKEIYNELLAEKESSAYTQKCNDVWNTIVDNSKIIAVPENEVTSVIEATFEKYEKYAANYNLTLDEFFEQNNSDYDTVYASVKASAEESIGEELVVFAVAHAEGMTVTDKEYDEGAQTYADNMGYASIEALEEAYGKQVILKSIMWDKVVKFVVEKAVAVEENTDEITSAETTPVETTPAA